MFPSHLLTPEQLATYQAYRQELAQHVAEGTSLRQRYLRAHQTLTPVETDLVCVWEDPNELDAPMRITHPSARYLAQLMAGGVHPPIEAHHGTLLLIVSKQDGRHRVCRRIEREKVRRELGPEFSEYLVDARLVQKETAGPMTVEQAVEYVIQKDVPAYVWKEEHNRPMFKIIKRDQLPTSRQFRDAWRLGVEQKEAA
jgi:hypothetical protein